MDNLRLALQGGWNVLSSALIFGAGLPVLYALAIRSLAGSATTDVDGEGRVHAQASPLGKAVAGLILLAILLGVALGITLIAASGFGKVVQFVGDFPFVDLVSKKK